MPTLIDTLAAGRIVAAHRPCPRVVVDGDLWRDIATHLAEGRWTLSGLWGDAGAVHMAVIDEGEGKLASCHTAAMAAQGQVHPRRSPGGRAILRITVGLARPCLDAAGPAPSWQPIPTSQPCRPANRSRQTL
jgi:hypothetical protein